MSLKLLTLHSVHESLGAKMVPFAGYSMPIQYSSVIKEHLAVRNQVGIFDVSHMGEFIIKGKNALDLVQKISSNDAVKLAIGDAQYAYMPNRAGGIVDDMLVYRTDDQEFMLVVNASNVAKDWDWIKGNNDLGVTMKDQSDDICLFAVQGPLATDTLQKLTTVDLSTIDYYSFITSSMGGIEDVIISATGYTGAGGFELYVPADKTIKLWDKIMQAGSEFGILPIGLGARDTLRIEKGYCLYGNDIDESTSPLEAGLGWVTKFTKPFVNSDHLLLQKKHGLSQKLVGFMMIERGIPRHDYDIVNEGDEIIGRVTSGTQSPILDQGIGMGYIMTEYAQPGDVIYILIRNKKVKATVVKMPFL